jgi:hypothetical protein
MVVVPGSCLEARRVTGRFDAPHQVDTCARRQYVIDGLGGHRTEPLPDTRRDLVGRGVWMFGEPLEHGDPRRGDPETDRSETLLHGALLVSHDQFSLPCFLE